MEKYEIKQKLEKLKDVYSKCPRINGLISDYLDCLQNGTRGFELSDHYTNYRSTYKMNNAVNSGECVIIKNKNNESMLIDFCENFQDNRFVIYNIFRDSEDKILCYLTQTGEYYIEETGTIYDDRNQEILKSAKNTKYDSSGLMKAQGYKQNSKENGKSGYVCECFDNDMIISDYNNGAYLYTGEVVDFCRQGSYSIDNVRNNSHTNPEWQGKKLSDEYVDLKQINQLAASLGYSEIGTNELVNIPVI